MTTKTPGAEFALSPDLIDFAARRALALIFDDSLETPELVDAVFDRRPYSLARLYRAVGVWGVAPGGAIRERTAPFAMAFVYQLALVAERFGQPLRQEHILALRERIPALRALSLADVAAELAEAADEAAAERAAA